MEYDWFKGTLLFIFHHPCSIFQTPVNHPSIFYSTSVGRGKNRENKKDTEWKRAVATERMRERYRVVERGRKRERKRERYRVVERKEKGEGEREIQSGKEG